MMLALATAPAALPLRAEIISYTDQQGHRIYVNTEDKELRRAMSRGGLSSALKLMERRREALEGIDDHINKEAKNYNVDPALVRAMIQVESAWNHLARSSKGAVGLMQLLPATAARFGVTDLLDPFENVTGGVRYLRWLLDHFNNNTELAVAAYNAGENAVEANGGVPPYRETLRYVERLRTLYGRLEGSHSSGRIYSEVDREGHIVYMNE
jgi:soluble lytic murein transglycosylase-like protein